MVEHANELQHRYLLVNGDAVSREAFTERPVHELQHYPTILCKVKDGTKVAASLQEAEKIISDEIEKVPESSTPEETVPEEPSTVEEEESTSAMFARLF